MDDKVILKNKATGKVKVLTFAHALEVFKNADINAFECIDEKHQIVKNELIKRASDSGSKETTKSKRAKKGGKVPK